MDDDAELRIMSLIINYEVAVKRCQTDKDLIKLMADTVELGYDDEGNPFAKLRDHLGQQLQEQCEPNVAKDLTQQIESKSLRALKLRMRRPASD